MGHAGDDNAPLLLEYMVAPIQHGAARAPKSGNAPAR